jgi:GNAT superfamily N-acetyltransferase
VDSTPYRFMPVTPERVDDLERFSRAHGKFRYCSCMRWRMQSARYREAGRDGRIVALDEFARSGRPAGMLAYQGEDVVGWCSIAPRDSYRAIAASRVIPQTGEAGVWAVTCFFLAPAVRRSGLLSPLLEAACEYAARSGAAVAEAYPWPGGASYRFMGTRELYLRAGFHDVPGPDGYRPVMRRVLDRNGS